MTLKLYVSWSTGTLAFWTPHPVGVIFSHLDADAHSPPRMRWSPKSYQFLQRPECTAAKRRRLCAKGSRYLSQNEHAPKPQRGGHLASAARIWAAPYEYGGRLWWNMANAGRQRSRRGTGHITWGKVAPPKWKPCKCSGHPYAIISICFIWSSKVSPHLYSQCFSQCLIILLEHGIMGNSKIWVYRTLSLEFH